MSKRTNKIISVVMLLFIVVPMVLGLLTQCRGQQGARPDAEAVAADLERAHLPIIQYDLTPTPSATPTPPPPPTPAPYSAAAVLFITPFGPLNASTFNPGAFVVDNRSLQGERIASVRIDLSTAVFPKMVFDPFGTAGDNVAKDVTVDGKNGLDFRGHRYEAPRGGGFDVLVLDFGKFDPGDSFSFSVDIDPNSIKGSGAPGPGESGSVAGLELIGSTVTVTFENGLVVSGEVERMLDPGNDAGALAYVREQLPERPSLTILNQSPPATVSVVEQTVRVSGPPGQPVLVRVIEGGLFTEGLPGGGFEIEPFDANNALGFREATAVVGAAGYVDVPIALSRLLPEGGLNYITAVFDNGAGFRGPVAGPAILEFVP